MYIYNIHIFNTLFEIYRAEALAEGNLYVL